MNICKEYDAAGAYLIMKGWGCGDQIPAEEVQVLLANFHEENLDVVLSQFKQGWRGNITHARQEKV